MKDSKKSGPKKEDAKEIEQSIHPQKPDVNNPDLGRQTTEPTKSSSLGSTISNAEM